MRIARGLGRETIAECVESADLQACLREQGIDYAQGFHIGRPVAVERAPQIRRATV